MIGTVVMWALAIFGYGFMMGVCHGAAKRFGFNDLSFDNDPFPLFWPIVLPAILGMYIMRDTDPRKLSGWSDE